MYPNSTSGSAAISQVELGNGPELKTLDFDKDSDEYCQFAVAFPKSWNESTVTFQAFFTANSTNTGTTLFKLAGVALADDGLLNTAFGTAVFGILIDKGFSIEQISLVSATYILVSIVSLFFIRKNLNPIKIA